MPRFDEISAVCQTETAFEILMFCRQPRSWTEIKLFFASRFSSRTVYSLNKLLQNYLLEKIFDKKTGKTKYHLTALGHNVLTMVSVIEKAL